MRQIKMKNIEAAMDDAGIWTSETPGVASYLQLLSDRIARSIGPEDGDFIAAKFYRTVAGIRGAKVSDTSIIHGVAGRIY